MWVSVGNRVGVEFSLYPVVEGISVTLPILLLGALIAGFIWGAVLSQKAAQGDFLRHSVRVGRHALMQDVLERTLVLYDLEADPREKHPLDLRDPHVRATAELLERILRAHLTGNIEDRQLTRCRSP